LKINELKSISRALEGFRKPVTIQEFSPPHPTKKLLTRAKVGYTLILAIHIGQVALRDRVCPISLFKHLMNERVAPLMRRMRCMPFGWRIGLPAVFQRKQLNPYVMASIS
jgi:hypothetical protein